MTSNLRCKSMKNRVGNDGEEGEVRFLGSLVCWINRSTLNGVVDEDLDWKPMEQFHSMQTRMANDGSLATQRFC